MRPFGTRAIGTTGCPWSSSTGPASASPVRSGTGAPAGSASTRGWPRHQARAKPRWRSRPAKSALSAAVVRKPQPAASNPPCPQDWAAAVAAGRCPRRRACQGRGAPAVKVSVRDLPGSRRLRHGQRGGRGAARGVSHCTPNGPLGDSPAGLQESPRCPHANCRCWTPARWSSLSGRQPVAPEAPGPGTPEPPRTEAARLPGAQSRRTALTLSNHLR